MQSFTKRIMTFAKFNNTIFQKQIVKRNIHAIQWKNRNVEKNSRNHRCLSQTIQNENSSKNIHWKLKRIFCKRVTSKNEKNIESKIQILRHKIEHKRILHEKNENEIAKKFYKTIRYKIWITWREKYKKIHQTLN